MGSLRLPLLAAIAAAPVQCGPTPTQEGQAVLVAAPLVVLLALAVQAILIALWRRRWPDVALRPRPVLVVVGLLVGPAVAAALDEGMAEAVTALWLFGCSYGSLLLVATRILLFFDRRHAAALAHLPPLLLLVGPAVPLALGWVERGRLTDLAERLFVWPGYAGWVTGPLFVGLLIEALWRGSRRAARA